MASYLVTTLCSTLHTVGSNFLAYCTGLRELTVTGSINSIGGKPFDGFSTTNIALYLCEAEMPTGQDLSDRKWRGKTWGSIDQWNSAA